MRFSRALKTIYALVEQALPLISNNEENPHLENFFYQISLCQAILGKNSEAQSTLIKLIEIRKSLYTIKGCCTVDPLKLLLDPYSKLCFVYEELGQQQESLRLCEKAIQMITDKNMINIEDTIYTQL